MAYLRDPDPDDEAELTPEMEALAREVEYDHPDLDDALYTDEHGPAFEAPGDDGES